MNLIARCAIPLLMSAAILPARGAGVCTPDARKAIAALDPIQSRNGAPSIRAMSDQDRKNVQTCLDEQRCYPAVATKTDRSDGVIGRYTSQALSNAAEGRCVAPRSVAPQCGETTAGRMSSWVLTKEIIEKLLNPPKNADDSSDADSSSSQPIASDLPVDKQFEGALGNMQGAEYPSRDLFENALEFFVRKSFRDDAKADLFLKGNKQDITVIANNACAPHSDSDARADWAPDYGALMLDSLSAPVYAFFPFWLSDPAAPAPPAGDGKGVDSKKPPAPLKVDFGMLDRVGWFGVTVNDDGSLDREAVDNNGSAVAKQVETARRFRTNVDLVVYKHLSRDQWIQLAYGYSLGPGQSRPSDFIHKLSTTIASEVGIRLNGFLDRVQRWIMPGRLTFPTTKWDGVTLYFEEFPWDEEGSMRFLNNLLSAIRRELNEKQNERYQTVWSRNADPLELNLFVPFDAFVPEKTSKELHPAQATSDLAVNWLARSVPHEKGDNNAECQPGDKRPSDVVCRFITFLKQGTSDRKKELRLAIENAFNRSAKNQGLLTDDDRTSLAVWRYQMLRRVIVVLSPATWKYEGDYPRPGMQMNDDMVYASNNFSAVGFWPVPAYGVKPEPLNCDPNTAKAPLSLACDVRAVFKEQGGDVFQRNLTPALENLLGAAFSDRFGGWRREIYLGIFCVYAILLLLWAVCLFSFELRSVMIKYWYASIGVAGFALVVFCALCLLDRRLREWAQLVFIGITVLIGIGLVFWGYYRSVIETDLP